MAKKNRKIGRKSLAILLTLLMVFSLFQVAALAADMNCGLPEHTHADSCYTTIEHTHGDEASECYSDHVHNGWCDTERHVHSTETCAYTTHQHGDDCYEAHQHDRNCYGIVCGEEESRRPGGHRHGNDCYGISCGLEGTDEQVCGYGDGEIIYSCAIQYEYPNCPARDFACDLEVGENIVEICGYSEHTHSKACYPSSGNYHFDHIDIRIETGDYTLSIGGESYTLTIAFSGDASDTFSITVPNGDKRDDGKTLTLVPELQHDEGANVGEFGLKQLELANYHSPGEFTISGTVLVPKSQVDALPEVLRAEFENLPTAEYTADQVHSGKNDDGGVYYRLPLNNYRPASNTCTGTPTGMLNHSRKGYDFEIHPEAILTPITDFVVVNKVVISETGEVINGETQDFTFSLGNISGTIGSPISLKGGESGSFTGLSSGLYTVTENVIEGYKPVAYNGQSWDEALYVQEVQSVSKVDGTAGSVTFYNMKLVDKGSLSVTKFVGGTAASGYNGRYSFDIKNAQGETVATMVLTNGQSEEIIVPAGTYTVTETGAAANGTDTLTVYANQQLLELGEVGYTTTVDVAKGSTSYVTFTNNYDKELPPAPPEPPAPQYEDWTVIHNYYLNGTDLEGSTSGTVSVEVGQQPAASDYARVYTYSENTYVDLGEIVIDAQNRTITLNYNREVNVPPAPPEPPAPQYEDWTVIHNYYLNGTDLEGSTSGTVSVEVGQQPAADQYARVYTYSENTYVDLGEIVIDSETRTITLNYNREVNVPPAPPEPPAPQYEDWTVIHNYYLNGTDLEGSTSGTVSVEVGQQPAADQYARVYTYGENTYVDLGEIVIDAQTRTITLNYNRVVSAPPAPYIPPVVIIPVNPTPPPVVIPDEPVPQVEIPDEPVPQAETPSGSAPTVDIPDEEVPLAQVPQTSDKMAAYIAIAAVSALSLSALVLTRKLRRSEEE